MRMLIYGGTEHNVRCRIGSWNVVPGVLSDLYGIPESGWIIGFGILAGESFLFLKTMQRGAGGRPYAYTILLDPGEEIWEKFGWNAVSFALSLLNRNQYFEQLLNKPDFFDENRLKSMVEGLSPLKFEAKYGKLSDLIAGSIFVEKPIAVNPKALGFGVSDFEDIAAQIESLPPFLRTGKGWLFGGSLENAKYLGANVVFDENAVNLNQKEIEQIEHEGSILQQDLNHFSHLPEINPVLEEYRKVPIWQWETKFQLKPSDFFQRADELLWLEKNEIPDDELDAKDNQTKIEGVFGKEIREAFLRSVCQPNGHFSAKKTQFILNKVNNGEITGKNVPVKMLEPVVYNDWLIKHGKLPSEFGQPDRFNIHELRRNCRELITSESDMRQMPQVLKKVIGELEKNGGEDFCQEMAITAFNKTKLNWQQIWINYRSEDFFKKYLAEFLANLARENVKNDNPNWMGYLYYSNDLGGHWLSSAVIKLKASDFINWALKHYGQSKINPRTTTKWLTALVTSPLRNKLTNNEKLLIVQSDKELAAAWQNFTALNAILAGEKAAHHAPAEEILYLRGELKELLSRQRGFKPNAKIEQALKKIFGELPEEYLNFKNSTETAAETKPAQVKKTSAQKSAESSPSDATLDFSKLRNTADEMVKKQRELAQAVSEALQNKDSQLLLTADFWDTKQFPLKEIFPSLPLYLRAEILYLLSKADSKRFVREIDNLFNVNPHDPFSLSIWECFILTEKGERLRQKVNKPVEKLREFISQAAGANVWKLPNLLTKEPEEAAEKPKDKGLFDRLLGR